MRSDATPGAMMRGVRPRLIVVLLALASVVGTAAAQGVGEPLASFELRDQDGVLVSTADLAGRSWMVNVWASWCPPCRAELPLLERAADELEEHGIGLLLINTGETASVARAFLEAEGLELRTLVDPDERDAGVERTLEVLHRMRARGLPTTYFVDPDGVIVSLYVGELTPEALAERLETLGAEWRP